MKAQKILYFSFLFSIHFIFGQNYQELQKLQEEYKKALERQSLSQPAEISNAEQTIKSASLPDKLIYSRKDIESLLVNTEKLLLKLKFLEDTTNKMPYVGYDFFTKRDSIPFWQNLPISKDYILGPGDEIIISMWGESNSLLTEVINRDGQIFVEKIGILNLGGKSLNEAKQHIISKYSRVYSTLVSPIPKSYVDLTLGELKSINVHFVGFVNIPGVHMVHPFSNVITGLIQAGGVDNMGTLRDIQIIRNDQILDNVDLYDYLISGKSFNTTRLLDQDIIYVPPRYSTIPITGRVLRPGYYESLKDEDLEDLIGFSGGRNSKSSNHIFLYKDDNGTNNGFIVEYNKRSNFLINQGDSIHIPSTNFNYSYVQIQGRIKNPGKYPFNSEMRIKNLIESTNSLDDEDFYRTMDLSRILVFRKNPDDQNPIKILTDINKNIFKKW